MGLANHYLHIEKDAARILELKSTALVACEPQKAAFRKAVSARMQCSQKTGIAPAALDTMAMFMNVGHSTPQIDALTKDTKRRIQKAGTDYMLATDALYAALAQSFAAQGMRTVYGQSNKSSDIPEGYTSAAKIISEMKRDMERCALAASATTAHGTVQGRG